MTEHPPELVGAIWRHRYPRIIGSVGSRAADSECVRWLDALAASGHLVISREDAQAIVDASEGFTTTSNAALDRLAALLEGRTDG